MAVARIALVTGASRGIGLAIAERLAADGWSMALTARSLEGLADAVSRVEAAGARAVAVAADLRDPAAPQQIVGEVTARLGPIDLLVNNAGTAPSQKVESTSDAVLDEVIDLHFKAPFRLVRALLPGMTERGGCLVQLASTAALKGYPLTVAYSAAKHAMLGMTRALAVELSARPIRVYAVCPGFVDTDITRRGAAKVAGLGRRTVEQVLEAYASMNACKRLIQPDEVAAVVARVADPASDVPSGAIYVLDDMPPTLVEGPST